MHNEDLYDPILNAMRDSYLAKELEMFVLGAIEYRYNNGEISKEQFEKDSKEINDEIDRLTGRNNPDLPKISLYEIDQRMHARKSKDNI